MPREPNHSEIKRAGLRKRVHRNQARLKSDGVAWSWELARGPYQKAQLLNRTAGLSQRETF